MIRRAAAIALLLVASACTRNGPSVSFGAICAPPEDAQACQFSATCAAQYIGDEVLDLGQTDRLRLFVELRNASLDPTDASAGRGNSQDAYLQEIRVEYAGAVALPATRTRTVGWVPAEGTGVLQVQVFEGAGLTGASVPAGASGTVVAKITGTGVFADGSSFETPVWEVPVTVCNGCIGPPAACPTAGDVRFVCPSWGQFPASTTCAAP